jgi:hypothetical protein
MKSPAKLAQKVLKNDEKLSNLNSSVEEERKYNDF